MSEPLAPFSQLVVGVDFSAQSAEAVAHALAVARVSGARVALVHVGVVPEVPEVPASMAATADALREILLKRLAADRERLEELRARLSGQGVEISHAVVDEPTGGDLASAARDLRADLIVVGTHGRTGLRRLLLGSVAERTVRLSDRSVLVVRGAAPLGGYRRIVVGTDFSPAADRALDRALTLAAPGGDVHVVHCQAPLIREADDPPELEILAARLTRARTEVAIERGRELLGPRERDDATLRFDALETPPALGLDAMASIDHADLVVVGSHGRRGLPRLILGSVAESTVRHAPCSVLVAR